MKRVFFVVLFILLLPFAGSAAPEQTVFGPVKYDVKERNGKDNLYKDSFKAADGLYIIQLQNGGQPAERVSLMEFSLNGEKLLREENYNFGFLVCIVKLHHENTFELMLKDAKPSGLKRPALPPRFVTLSVMRYTGKLPKATYGVNNMDQLKDIAGLLQKITNPDTASLALSSVNLENDTARRAEAMRRLSDRTDQSAQPIIASIFNDPTIDPDIRGEAAIALGMLKDKSSVPSLVKGVLDSDAKTRMGSARALSLFPEDDTREPLTGMLKQLDAMRMGAVIRTISDAGWKPVSTLMTLAESKDRLTSATAVRLLGNTGDARATDLLLKLLNDPGPRDIKAIITALGETKDSRAAAPLAAMAKDPQKRAGNEAELGEALAALGDPSHAEVIAEMIRKTDWRPTSLRLEQAYKSLTGKNYR